MYTCIFIFVNNQKTKITNKFITIPKSKKSSGNKTTMENIIIRLTKFDVLLNLAGGVVFLTLDFVPPFLKMFPVRVKCYK